MVVSDVMVMVWVVGKVVVVMKGVMTAGSDDASGCGDNFGGGDEK